MTYAVSDIHGCYDKYEELLKKIRFSPDDTLYVLGDVIDRGPDGFKIMRDMAARPNVLAQKGNHEAMALDALPGLWRCLREGDDTLTPAEADAMELWFHNGGESSLADFLNLEAEDAARVWDYMERMPLFREIAVGGRKFVLVHGGLEHFSPSRQLADYTWEELLWCRPEPDTVYYPDRYVILGHTPVFFLNRKTKQGASGQTFFRTDSFIDIDCGCVYRGGRLGCLCLNTMEEVYV